jgi:hypothetical protein
MMKFGKLRIRASSFRGKFHGRHVATSAAQPKESSRPSSRSALDRTPEDPAARWRLFEHDSLF